ncbi:MAG: nucleoside recognition protein [candidate division Zixibacteria bacterium]|nr:nucleoside recognition protein [candidate division Zixibacteria bacterium]
MPKNNGLSRSPADLFKEGIRQGLFSFYSLFKVMAPIYILVSILKYYRLLDYLAGHFAPFMKYVGLPGEAAPAMVLGWGINIYAAIAAFAGLNMTPRQVTILGVMLGTSHTLFMETAVVGRMKARPGVILVLRLGVGIILGLLLNIILPENL